MRMTGFSDTESPEGDVGKLRVTVCDELASKRGAVGPEKQALLFGIHRSTLYRIRNGERIASLPLALHMARKLRTKVEKLFVDEAAR